MMIKYWTITKIYYIIDDIKLKKKKKRNGLKLKKDIYTYKWIPK